MILYLKIYKNYCIIHIMKIEMKGCFVIYEKNGQF